MGYSVIKSFERGIDTRRLIDTTEPGALLAGRDCHITRGGEIEKRAAFVITATLPASTTGFYATRGPTFHTWGIAATAPAGMPTNGVYHAVPLPAPDELTPIEAILSVEEFGGKLYVIVKYANGLVRHWYGDDLLYTNFGPGFVMPTIPPPAPGTLADIIPLPGPTPPSAPAPGKPQVSFKLVTSDFAGLGYDFLRGVHLTSPSATMVDGPASEWTEPDGKKLRLIPSMTTYGYWGPPLAAYLAYGNDAGWILHPAGAGGEAEFVSLINAQTPAAGDPKVWASYSGSVVTIWIDQQTTKYNGWTLYAYTDLFLIFQNPAGDWYTPVLSGGVDAPPPDPEDPPPEDPEPINVGTFVLAHNEKLYCTYQQLLNFTALRDPTAWGTLAGGGYIDHTMMGEGMPNLVSLADYGGDLAVFADRHIFIWKMDPDPLKNFKRQVLHRTGTIAPHSVVSFGQNEVMYLDRSGIRSLRQREANDAGFASDLGNNIDELVKAKIKTTSVLQQRYNFWADVEPTSGRLWMGMLDVIYVLSYFPGNHIAAWTWYDASSAPIDMLNSTDEHIYWRSGNNVIVYGGESGEQYDLTEAIAQAPYIDAGKPATSKTWNAIDAALLGTWQIRASFDPTQPAAFDLLANVTKSTYAQEKIAVNGKSPSLSLELRTTFPGPARIGNATLHYEENYSD